MTSRCRRSHRATELEIAVLSALGTSGTMKGAAHTLGISERTAYRRLDRLRSRLGAKTVVQAAMMLGVESLPLSRSEMAVLATSDDLT